MKLIKTKNYKELSKKAAELIISEVKEKPNLVICFATGKTPRGIYKSLVKSYKKKKIDFSKVGCFNLDEYYPIEKSDKKSFYYYLVNRLFSKINIKKKNINLLNGETKNPKLECLNYEKKIKKQGIDLAILGVGVNGHIAFNEPGSSFSSKTRVVELAKETIKRNSGFYNKVPNKALTTGINTIMKSKEIILLANGKSKSEAIKHLVKDKPDKSWPITFLKRHKNLIVIISKEVLK
ncbi:MAG: glucosamine-6-phosphate deaminase [Nanoarchaeota archaeon]|nr:glucosamine-6-phosphate deaminase [Nanoarchaeota archaeon]MBU1027590.1 glucosamine-6-phosphate deaminase [Nanoarchaeota archaeon]